MSPAHLVLGILLATLTALPLVAEELSLRERVERARAAARERAGTEAPRSHPKEAASLDPEMDPELWRISRYHIVCEGRHSKCAGSGDWEPVQGFEKRFYTPGRFLAHPGPEGIDTEVTERSKVFFYFVGQDGELHLAGRGTVARVRHGKKPLVDAIIENCRFISTVTAQDYDETHDFMKLIPERYPDKMPWYMSRKLKGPDVEGWDAENIRRFALGQPWMGMRRGVLEAMLGEPEDKLDVSGVVSLVYGTGQDAMRYDITNGVVTGRVPVNQF